jgi:hypothetical protein
MFTFDVRAGKLTENGAPVLGGNSVYSGHGEGLNNPDMEQVQGVGPLPRGKYRVGPAYDDPHLGVCVMHLDPLPGTNEFGRSLFRMHGDNSHMDHTASDGCIIAPHDVRVHVSGALDRVLEVV